MAHLETAVDNGGERARLAERGQQNLPGLPAVAATVGHVRNQIVVFLRHLAASARTNKPLGGFMVGLSNGI